MSTEKNEKEIRQVNFRIDQASADAFRSFCTANGMNPHNYVGRRKSS